MEKAANYVENVPRGRKKASPEPISLPQHTHFNLLSAIVFPKYLRVSNTDFKTSSPSSYPKARPTVLLGTHNYLSSIRLKTFENGDYNRVTGQTSLALYILTMLR